MSGRWVTCALATGVFAAAAPFALAQAGAEKKAAEAPKAMEAPKPAPEMASLKAFDGNWTCHGEMPASPMGPQHKTSSTVQSHRGMGGFWQVGTVKMAAAGGMPAFEGTFHITYEPGSKQYVMVWLDNMGGFSQEMAPAWEGDKLAFTGEGTMGGQKMAARDTFTKKADGSLVHSAEGQMNGQWVSMGEETCTKAAAPAKK